jgi:hypothetical protein
MDAPSIKGSAFQSVVEDVQRLLEGDRISREELEVRLEPADLPLLDEKVLPALWYPIGTYRRLSELLMEIEGGGRTEYLVRRGARAAERLFALGIYQQLRRGEAIAEEIRSSGSLWSQQDGAIMASLAGAIFSFTTWRFVADAENRGEHRIEVSDAAALPEVARFAAQGFIEYVSTRLAKAHVRVTSERPAPDRIVFQLKPTRSAKI